MRKIHGIELDVDARRDVFGQDESYVSGTVRMDADGLSTERIEVDLLEPVELGTSDRDIEDLFVVDVASSISESVKEHVSPIAGRLVKNALTSKGRPRIRLFATAASLLAIGIVIGSSCTSVSQQVEQKAKGKALVDVSNDRPTKNSSDLSVEECVVWAMSKKLGDDERFRHVFTTLRANHLNAGLIKAVLYAHARLQLNGKDDPRVVLAKEYLMEFNPREVAIFINQNSKTHGHTPKSVLEKYREVISP